MIKYLTFIVAALCIDVATAHTASKDKCSEFKAGQKVKLTSNTFYSECLCIVRRVVIDENKCKHLYDIDDCMCNGELFDDISGRYYRSELIPIKSL